MAVEPISILFTGLHFAVLFVVYGWLIGVLWSPFLLAGRLRALFDALPHDDWRVNYGLWIPTPAVVWGFFFGSALSLSRDVRPPTQASELYVAGVDGIVVATAVSLVLWPAVLLLLLPARGVDWDPNDYGPSTVVLVVASCCWYLLFLVGPAYGFSVLAGFGDVMSGP